MYTNQFQKYNPEPFVEVDIPPHVVADDGPARVSLAMAASSLLAETLPMKLTKTSVVVGA